MISAQSLKDRLQTVSRAKNIPFNACWKQFLLERFLVRLARSEHSSRFIFKGGFLLSFLMEIGRETTDLDFLLTRMKVEEKALKEMFKQMISVHSADGFVFSFDSIELLQQPHMDYPGYRIVLCAAFAKMRDKIQIDVGVGDIVEPLLREIPLVQYQGKPFFEDIISLLVYPVETIFAEKLETILSKGPSNSRMKDYHDLILLIRNGGILNRDQLVVAITNTFSHRGTVLHSINFEESALKMIQSLWTSHLQGLGDNTKGLNLPKDISMVIEELNEYVLGTLSLSITERVYSQTVGRH